MKQLLRRMIYRAKRAIVPHFWNLRLKVKVKCLLPLYIGKVIVHGG